MQPQTIPIPLIQFNEQRFFITEEAKRFLSELDQPLGIITIVGKYRTGKSLFLNKVLLNNKPTTEMQEQQISSKCSFRVCPTINSCTKGLWISKQTIQSQHPEYDGMKVLVIDSQGFGAMQQSDKYCNNILLLALLLSSYFIYNSVGSIDEKSLNNLNIITNLAKDLQSKNMGNDKLQEQFPSFLWVVRDFTLKIVDSNGCQIEPKMYLEEALEIRKGVSDAIQNKNKIRRMIKHFFKERDCFTLVTPVTSEDKLQKLNTLTDEQFRPQFLEQINTLRQKILRKIKPKKLKNRKITGPTFLEMAQTFSQAINNGSLPNLESTWKHITNFQTTRSVNKIKQSIEQKISKFTQKLHTQIQISEFQKQLLSSSLEKCRKLLVHEKQVSQNYQKIKEDIAAKIIEVREINNRSSMRLIIDTFEERNLKFMESKPTTLEGLAAQLNQEIKYFEKEFSNNPGLPIFLSSQLYPMCMDQLINFTKLQKKTHLDQINKLTETKNEQHSTISQLNQKMAQKDHELQSLKQQLEMQNIKSQQNLKIKDIEYEYLLKENKDAKNDIRVLLQKLDKVEAQLTEQRSMKYEMISKKEVVEGGYRELEQNRKYLSKEIQILKNTLTAKTEQISNNRQQITELRCQLQKSQEREKSYINKAKTEIQLKSTDYEKISSKYESAQKQILALSQKLTQVETRLGEQKSSHLKQKNIMDDIFETLKNSLQSEIRNKDELIETNKNMGFALKHLEQRFQHIEEKQKKLKEFKRCIKNSSCLQCINCSKFYVPTIFSQHLNVCIIGPESMKQNQKENTVSVEQIEIRVIQTLLKDSDSKPYTEYVLQLRKGSKTWKIQRKYKAFCDLHSQLKAQFPGVGLSQNSFIVCPQDGTKKSLLVEQRRKILQKYLNDLCKNPLILYSHIFRQFIEDSSEPELVSIQSPSKLAISELMKSNVLSEMGSPDKENYSITNKNTLKSTYKSPEQFLKIWNERNLRAKQITKSRNIK